MWLCVRKPSESTSLRQPFLVGPPDTALPLMSSTSAAAGTIKRGVTGKKREEEREEGDGKRSPPPSVNLRRKQRPARTSKERDRGG